MLKGKSSFSEWLLFAILCCCCLVAEGYCGGKEPHLYNPAEETPLNGLWASEGWRKLLHFPDNDSGIEVSRVDRGNFFLSLEGRSDPAAEGRKMIEALREVSTRSVDESVDPRCRFPARFTFLQRHIKISPYFDPADNCATLRNWLEGINPSGVTLVFPVSYLNNPASIFGHTLLRIDSQEFSPDYPLLAASVGYSAVTDDDRGVVYAAKGIFGGYTGRYSAEPYYLHASRYGELDNRDIWEYRLDFTKDETIFLLLHVWELRQAEFDYFFFTENCSFQLLSLLEAVRPKLRLSSKYRLWTLPVETVRDVIEELGDGDVPVVYRPSLRTRLEYAGDLHGNRDLISSAKKAARGIISDQNSLYREMSQEDIAKFLDMALLYSRLLSGKHEEAGNDTREILYQIGKARSTVDVQKENILVPAPEVRPDQVHKPGRYGLGTGLAEDGGYISLDYRAVLHDLCDNPRGYDPGYSIEVAYPKIRFYPDKQKLVIESFDLINIISVNPGGNFVKPLAWTVRGGVGRSLVEGNYYETLGYGHAAFGASASVSDSVTVYGLLGGSVYSARYLDREIDIGPSLIVGVFGTIMNSWTASLEARGTTLLIDSSADDLIYELALENNIMLDNDSSFRMDFSVRRDYEATAWSINLRYMKYFRFLK